jgi:hypothetical protein
MWRDRYGAFEVTAPNEAMQAFLCAERSDEPASGLQASEGQTDAAAIRSDAGEPDDPPAKAALRRNETE